MPLRISLKSAAYIFVIGLLSLIASGTCLAEENPNWTCTSDLKILGDCFTVHGRLKTYKGTPSVRLWPVGTERLLGVLPDDTEIEIIEPYLNFGMNVYGDFFVCPMSKELPGHMQMVCIESGRNLVVEKLGPRKDQTEVFKLKNSWENNRSLPDN